jgi:hypothetical protein
MIVKTIPKIISIVSRFIKRNNEIKIPKKGNTGNFPIEKGILNFLIVWGCLYLNLIKDKLTIINVVKTMKLVNPATTEISLKNKNEIAIIEVINMALVGVFFIPILEKNLNFLNISLRP